MSDEASLPASSEPERPSISKELVQPFIDLVHAPRALWGVNLAYMLEGLCYFGILTYLEIHFSDFIFVGVPHAEVWAHDMVAVLTAGIALSMAVVGFVPDKWGVRKALILSFILLLVGRVLIASAPTVLGLSPAGLGSALHWVTMGGIVLVLFGYGMYQPAAYSAVREFTTPKTAAMGYAMLYALMNGGSSLLMLAFLLRDKEYVGLGIPGMFWIFTALTAVSLVLTVVILSRKTVEDATAAAKAETAALAKAEAAAQAKAEPKVQATGADGEVAIPVTVWIVLVGIIAGFVVKLPSPWHNWAALAVLLSPVVVGLLPAGARRKVVQWVATHPLADTKFFVFIFVLIPVQTLFTYNWLILPQYISRSYAGWIGQDYEVFSNANPILIFALVPVITALTYRRKIYSMMIFGTAVMGASPFVLALGPTPLTLTIYIILMTIGEALWQPRFLGYATEIAPEGKAGLYQGVAQLPWFLTKALVPLLYSGAAMERFCPATGSKDTQTMWLIFGFISISSTVLLLLMKGWLGKDFKTKAA